MKKHFFSIILLTTFFAFSLNASEQTRRKFIKLEDYAIRLVDGITGALDAAAMVDTLQTRNMLNTLLRGKPDKATKTFIKKYNFNGTKVSLNDLVIIEEELLQKNLPINHAEWIAFYEALNEMKKDFADFTKPLLEEAEEQREVNLRLIHEWTEKTGRFDSLLLSWGTIDEEAALKAATANDFRHFCIDLKNFLHDLMYSCPKARILFKKKYLPESDWEKFEDSFK